MTKFTSSLIITIILLALVIFIQRCNTGKYAPQKPDTISIKDTQYILSKKDTVYIPKPYKVEIPHDTIIYVSDTPKTLLDYRDAYFKLATQVLTSNYYSDSLQVKDSLGLYGMIYSKDTVYKNKLKGKSLSYNIIYPKIKETITITQYPKKKTMWFVGGSVLTDYLVNKIGVEFNTGFLNKKNQLYEIGIQNCNNEFIYKLGTKIKL